jgi:hypothetical protein
MVEKNKKVKEGNLTCGQCAVYPCFRHYTSSTGAGLCYQEVRECRQECDNFIQDIESGKAPLFIITGTCRKDNSKVIYDTPCKYEIEKRE